MKAQKQKTTTGSKRKDQDDDGRIPRKKVQTERSHAVARFPTKYREPKGIRKSGRIAGRPADPLDPQPRGQYNRDGTTPGVPASLGAVIVQSSIVRRSEPHSASAESTLSDSTQGESVSTSENLENSRSRARSFLEVVVSNLSSHNIIRHLVDGHKNGSTALML